MTYNLRRPALSIVEHEFDGYTIQARELYPDEWQAFIWNDRGEYCGCTSVWLGSSLALLHAENVIIKGVKKC